MSASATVYVPSEGALLVAQKGAEGTLLAEYAEAGFAAHIEVSCHRYYATEFEEFCSVQVPLDVPFDEKYPDGSDLSLARDAVSFLYGDAEFQLLPKAGEA